MIAPISPHLETTGDGLLTDDALEALASLLIELADQGESLDP